MFENLSNVSFLKIKFVFCQIKFNQKSFWLFYLVIYQICLSIMLYSFIIVPNLKNLLNNLKHLFKVSFIFSSFISHFCNADSLAGYICWYSLRIVSPWDLCLSYCELPWTSLQPMYAALWQGSVCNCFCCLPRESTSKGSFYHLLLWLEFLQNAGQIQILHLLK